MYFYFVYIFIYRERIYLYCMLFYWGLNKRVIIEWNKKVYFFYKNKKFVEVLNI